MLPYMINRTFQSLRWEILLDYPGELNILTRETEEARLVVEDKKMKARGWCDGGRGHEPREGGASRSEQDKETCSCSEPPEGASPAQTLTLPR